MITKIHHINFLVHDLDKAVLHYQKSLGITGFIFDSLTARAAKTARVKINGLWLILVQPLDQTGEPGKHLARYGEGFFLMSFGSNNFETDVARLQREGVSVDCCDRRRGLENWKVVDLPMKSFFGAQLQLTTELDT